MRTTLLVLSTLLLISSTCDALHLSETILNTSFRVFKKLPPETSQPFPQYVGNLGYPCETHKIRTTDGYINTFFRIQAKNTKIKPNLPVVYLQHGLVDSSDTWIVNVENQAPAFILAQAGYDVWVGNTRGNTYSQEFVPSGPGSNSTYWDFSWQEMSQFDLPAAFEYIHSKTGKSISYIGHSQGTTIMFAALCRHNPTVLKYLKHFIALAPVVYVDNIGSPEVNWVSKMQLGLILKAFDQKKFLFLPKIVHEGLATLCEVANAACVAQLRLISDSKPEFDNVDRMDIILGHFPAGTSVQNLNYWNQMLVDKNFTMFNYGKKGNIKHYGQEKPPGYDLSKINVPVYLFAGRYDELAYPNSTAKVRDQLTGSPKVFYKSYDLGHASFVWGKDVVGYFKDVLNIIKSDAPVNKIHK